MDEHKMQNEEADSYNAQNAATDVKALLEYAATLGMKEVPLEEVSSSISQNKKITDIPLISDKPKLSPAEKDKAIADLRKEMDDCKLCRLHSGRKNIVFGVGNPDAQLMFVGEGPGQDEDIQGEPFVGAAGQLLTKIIEAMGFKRADVYIGNIVKCRPPQNRNPAPDEAEVCMPFLIRQIEIVQPKVIVCLGSVAVQNLIGTEEKISRLRGKFLKWRGISVMPTYHPAFLLRNAAMKKPVWEDMKKVIQLLAQS